MDGPSMEISGSSVNVSQDGDKLVDGSVEQMVDAVLKRIEKKPSCGILPDGVKLWAERGSTIGLGIEVAAGPRVVDWITDDSEEPFGPGAKYEQRYLSFPYIEILIVLHEGRQTNFQQLFYRREPIHGGKNGEDLLLPNLLNVSPNAYEQLAWLCLAQMPSVRRYSWPRKVRAVVDHTFSAAFNRSSEMHEGSSYWKEMAGIDRRVKTVETWEKSTHDNRYFALDVDWKSAGTTASAQLGAMLDHVTKVKPISTATDLCSAMVSSGKPTRSRR